MLKKKNVLIKKIVVTFLVITLSMISFVYPAKAADEYDCLRAKWQNYLLGTSYDPTEPDIAVALESITSTANDYWTTMNTDSSRTCLWSDLSNWSVSSTITNHYKRLVAMAIAYKTSGSSLQGNQALADDILSGLDWMYANHYNAGMTEIDNWYEWEIGTPLQLNNAMILMFDQLSAQQISNYISAIDKWCPNADNRVLNKAAETGANRADKALALTIRGIVGKSSSKIDQGRDALSQIFLYSVSGDGYYADGSFIQHDHVPYTGGYGNVLLNDMAVLLYILNGSTWTITDPNVNNVFDWVTNSYESLIYKGSLMDGVRGRTLARKNEQGHVAARGIASAILLLSQAAPADKASLFKSMVKEWVQEDTTFSNYYMGYRDGVDNPNPAPLSIYRTMLLKSVMSDPTIIPRGELVKTQVFASMDRVAYLRPGFGIGLSMFSNRISAFESGNGENLKGWWTGVGMTQLYNNDLKQYSSDYWATVNSYRLPGTTTDGTGSGTPIAWHNYSNPNSWVGGSSVDGLYSSAGMQFSLSQNTGSPLQGKKSWFMLGDKMVALGAGIANTNGNSVETIVENRKLNSNGDNTLTVNGDVKSSGLGWSETMNNVQWAHLAGNTAGSDIGYYFPGTTALNGLRESRTDAWSSVGTGQSSTLCTNNYLSLAFDHGVNPTNDSYAYAVLPNKSASDMANYASNPDISILENSVEAQAVKEMSLNAVGANFWNDVTKTISVDGRNFITSDKKASVTTLETGNQIDIGVSDPTQSNTGTINIEINRSASGPISLDTGITVTQFSPTIKMTINVNGSLGKTFNTKFNLAPSVITNAPVLTSALSSDSKVSLSWPMVNGEAGYKIKYGTTAGNYTNTIDVTNVSSTNNYTLAGLTNGTTYYFAVSAVNAAGESDNSTEVSAVPNTQPNPHISLSSIADAYVRDGSYADTNYGTATTMAVKADGTGYNRYSFMKFDLSSITGGVTSAKIVLVPTSEGMSGITNQANLVSNNAWTESSVTWNNQPVASTLLSSWTVPAVGTSVQLDVTAQVNAALIGDKKLSICISSLTNQGSKSDVSYGTKENGNINYRPVIIIN